MTMSSDKLATIRQPTVTVHFDVDESGQERHISAELTNDELKHLISSLEAANKVGSRTQYISKIMFKKKSCVFCSVSCFEVPW